MKTQTPTEHSAQINKQLLILSVSEAIEKSTGLKLAKYAVPDKSLNLYYHRMVFSYQCHKHGISYFDIALKLRQTTHNVVKVLKKYNNEYLRSKEFRQIANYTEFYLAKLNEDITLSLISEYNAKLACETNDLGKSDTNVHENINVA